MTDEGVKGRVRDEYDAAAGGYERRWRQYLEASTTATLERLDVSRGGRLLDVGCGTGFLLARLLERHPTVQCAGVDLSPGMVAQARRRLPGSVTLAVADAERLPFATGSFDAVVSASSLHFWPSPARGLEELHRVLRPSGQIVLTDWCDDYLACRLCDRFLRMMDRGHSRIYGAEDCARMLAGARYDLIRLDAYRISWLWGLMTAVARKGARHP